MNEDMLCFCSYVYICIHVGIKPFSSLLDNFFFAALTSLVLPNASTYWLNYENLY